MNPAEVLALEVKQYVGQNLQTLVPRIIGQTAAAQQRQRSSGSGAPGDETRCFEALERDRPATEADVARELYEWARRHGLRVWRGRGQRVGAFLPMLDTHRRKYYSFAVTTDGRVHLQLHRMTGRPALADHEYARGMLEALRTVPGLEVSDERLDGVPSFDMRLLTEPTALARYIETFGAYLSHVRAHTGPIEP
jgi:hypothetical protein